VLTRSRRHCQLRIFSIIPRRRRSDRRGPLVQTLPCHCSGSSAPPVLLKAPKQSTMSAPETTSRSQQRLEQMLSAASSRPSTTNDAGGVTTPMTTTTTTTTNESGSPRRASVEADGKPSSNTASGNTAAAAAVVTAKKRSSAQGGDGEASLFAPHLLLLNSNGSNKKHAPERIVLGNLGSSSPETADGTETRVLHDDDADAQNKDPTTTTTTTTTTPPPHVVTKAMLETIRTEHEGIVKVAKRCFKAHQKARDDLDHLQERLREALDEAGRFRSMDEHNRKTIAVRGVCACG
jgi:hypothetical protein